MTNASKFAALAVFGATALFAQNSEPKPVSVSSYDAAAGRQATARRSHGLRSTSPQAQAVPKAALTQSGSSTLSASGGNSKRFPADLDFGGGPVVNFAESHAIYLNPSGACTVIANCWGDPEGFLRDLGASDFIHITDQYVNSRADNRYTVGQSAMIDFTPRASLSDNDILGFVGAVARTTGQVGYGHIYHVFLPPGQDVCQSFGVCASNAICAYHGSADLPFLGHVLYSVEPDQLSFGCSVQAGTPNGPRVDSTNNVLSHELFEIITDPDFDAWFNSASIVMLEDEIGDECEFFAGFSFDVPTFKIGKNSYAVQSEYDNKNHVCATKSN